MEPVQKAPGARTEAAPGLGKSFDDQEESASGEAGVDLAGLACQARGVRDRESPADRVRTAARAVPMHRDPVQALADSMEASGCQSVLKGDRN